MGKALKKAGNITVNAACKRALNAAYASLQDAFNSVPSDSEEEDVIRELRQDLDDLLEKCK